MRKGLSAQVLYVNTVRLHSLLTLEILHIGPIYVLKCEDI